MAVFRWRGDGPGVKTHVDDGRNWVDNAGVAYPQDTYPGAGADYTDDMIFDAALSETAGSPIGAEVMAALNKFAVMPAFNGSIGAIDDPLKFSAKNVLLQGTLAKDLWLEGRGLEIEEATMLDGKVTGRLIFGKLTVLKGKLTLSDNSSISGSLIVGYIASQASDVTLTLGSTTTLPDTITQYGGTVYCSSDIGDITLTGGIWSQDAGRFNDATIYNGTFSWNGTGRASEAWVYGGTFDCSKSQGVRGIGKIHAWPAGTVKLDSASDSVTVEQYIDDQGGKLLFPVGAKIERYMEVITADPDGVPFGIMPQSLSPNTTATGEGIDVGPTDQVTIHCLHGVGQGGTGGVTFKLWAATDDTFADAEVIGMASSNAQNSNTAIAVGGWAIPAGKRRLRVTAKNETNPGTPAFVAAQGIIRTTTV